MKKIIVALFVAVLAPVLVASADGSRVKKKTIVVDCPDLKCCPPLRQDEICVYVDTITCTDEKGKPVPC